MVLGSFASWGLRDFSLVHARDKTKNIFFVYFLTELRTNHLSYSIYEHLCLAKANKTIEQTGKHLTGNKLQIKKSKKNQINHVAKK